MASPGETEAFLEENASTIIYENHFEKEIAVGAVNGSRTAFFLSGSPAAVTGLTATVQAQFTDSSGNYFRKDILVYFRKDGVDTPVDTNSNAITISNGTVTFTTAPTTAEADKIVTSWSKTPSDRTDQIISMSWAGGGRPVESIQVQGGKRITVQRLQENRTVTLEVLSVDKGFVDYMNGNIVTQTGGPNSTDFTDGTVGSQARTPKTIRHSVTDPITNNKRIDIMYNVYQVTSEQAGPAEGELRETASFECSPQDFCRLNVRTGQNI